MYNYYIMCQIRVIKSHNDWSIFVSVWWRDIYGHWDIEGHVGGHNFVVEVSVTTMRPTVAAQHCHRGNLLNDLSIILTHVYRSCIHIELEIDCSWWRHQMEIFSALLAICAGKSPVPGEFPTQRPVTRSYDVFFDLRLNKRLSKQWWGWWFETPSRPLWRHRNVMLHSSLHQFAYEKAIGFYLFFCLIYPQIQPKHDRYQINQPSLAMS